MSHSSYKLLSRLHCRLYPCLYVQPNVGRLLHSTPTLTRSSASKKKTYMEQLTKDLPDSLFERKDKRGLKFDKVPLESSSEVEDHDEMMAEEEEEGESHYLEETDQDIVLPDVQSFPSTADSSTVADNPVKAAWTDSSTDADDSVKVAETDGSTDADSSTDSSTVVSVIAETYSSTDVPRNIMGDLDALFSDAPPEPIIQQELGVVETVQEVDYSVYYNPREGERYKLPELELGPSTFGNIPFNHIVQFLRDSRCFDSEIIQAPKGTFVEHVVIASTHNTKHLKDAGRSFYKMCRDDYHMKLTMPDWKAGAGAAWQAYDAGHTIVHFLLPMERARLNLESLWLGQDNPDEDLGTEEERYTADLLEGLFPDEDFTKLGKPFELMRADKERGRRRPRR